MIRKDQLESIDYLVENYRKDLIRATKLENQLNEGRLQELAREFSHLASFETNDLYVMQAVVEKTELIREKVEEAGLGTNKIHEQFPFGFAKSENELIEEFMQAQARFGYAVQIRCNTLYFTSYIEETLKGSAFKDGATYAGVPIYADESIYSYIIEFVKG